MEQNGTQGKLSKYFEELNVKYFEELNTSVMLSRP